jgi:hypothetical protein
MFLLFNVTIREKLCRKKLSGRWRRDRNAGSRSNISTLAGNFRKRGRG